MTSEGHIRIRNSPIFKFRSLAGALSTSSKSVKYCVHYSTTHVGIFTFSPIKRSLIRSRNFGTRKKRCGRRQRSNILDVSYLLRTRSS
jgi:hypothetical protein